MKGNVSLIREDPIPFHGMVFYTSCRSQGIFTINIMVAYSNLHTSQLKLAEHIFFPKDMQNLTLCRAHWDSGFSNFNPVIDTESQGYHSRILTFWRERKYRASRSQSKSRILTVFANFHDTSVAFLPEAVNGPEQVKLSKHSHTLP